MPCLDIFSTDRLKEANNGNQKLFYLMISCGSSTSKWLSGLPTCSFHICSSFNPSCCSSISNSFITTTKKSELNPRKPQIQMYHKVYLVSIGYWILHYDIPKYHFLLKYGCDYFILRVQHETQLMAL